MVKKSDIRAALVTLPEEIENAVFWRGAISHPTGLDGVWLSPDRAPSKDQHLRPTAYTEPRVD